MKQIEQKQNNMNNTEDYIKEIKQAIAREAARTPASNKPSPSDILLAAREMMRRVKEKDARSNKSNR
jgi:hypothetical protein